MHFVGFLMWQLISLSLQEHYLSHKVSVENQLMRSMLHLFHYLFRHLHLILLDTECELHHEKHRCLHHTYTLDEICIFCDYDLSLMICVGIEKYV